MSAFRAARGLGIIVLAIAASRLAPAGPPPTSEKAPAEAARPQPRSGHRMVYDRARGVVVCFGGWSATRAYLNDTWTWDGRTWSELQVPGPPPRAWHGFAYDDARSAAILFGGRDARGKSLADTWQWDGRAWRQLAVRGPAPRDHLALAFDRERRRVVLYGGFDSETERDHSDTWEWDGDRWLRAAEGGTEPLAAHSMAYDDAHGRIVLFGGMSGESAVAATRAWTGSAWLPVATNTVDGRSHTALVSLPRGRGLLRFGGKDSARIAHGDTWRLRGRRWQRINGAGPAPRIDHAAACDTRRGRVVLFGGKLPSPDETRFGDTWEWDGTAWRRIVG